ncbi:MAG: DUF445 family protein [Candidatus Sericytochromatia bacterium]
MFADINLLVVNIIAGAFVGYTTKMLAINMLFKKYPIIGGAEIIKDRDNLAISVSELVEERLIKPETLLNEFEKESFRESFQNLIKHIIEDTIIKNIESKEIIKIQDISGFDKTSENLKNFLFENESNILPKALDILYETIELEDVLSHNQLEKVLQKLIQLLSESVSENISSITSKFYEELEKLDIKNILSEKELNTFMDKVIDNDIYKEIQCILLENIDTYFNSIYDGLELDTLIDKIEISLKNKTLIELIGTNNSENSTLNSIVERLVIFINSEKGKIILQDFISTFIDVLKSLDIPLSTLLTRNIEKAIINFMEKNMPEVIDKLEIWLEINKKELEKILHKAIEEHLESENILKQVVGNIFSEEITERYKFIENTIQEVKKLIYESNDSFLKTINRFLDNTQVSDLTFFLEEKILDRKLIFEIILDIINKYATKINFSIFDTFLNKKLSEILIINEIDFKKIFKNYIYTFIIGKIKTDIISTNKLKEILIIYIDSNYSNINGKKLQKYANKEFFDNLNPIITSLANDKNIHGYVLKTASSTIKEVIGEKNINSLVNDEIKTEVLPKFSDLYKSKISDFLFMLKKEKILSIYSGVAKLYSDLCKNESFSKQLTNTLINLMNSLIRKNKMLEGKIKIAIKESFSKFSDNELKDEMNSFMGKELQPIKLLGAFLGALIGIGMYNISFMPNYGDYVKGYWALITYSLSYGITEVGTNWMAIKMLFKPYKPTKFPLFNLNLPFTPGVFPKNKKALAESMVNFIDKKLLSKENMKEILERYKEKWEENIKNALADNNYNLLDQVIYNYTKEHYDSTANVLLDILFKEVNNNKDIISEYIVEEIRKIYLDEKDLEFIKNQISIKINESKEFLGAFLEKDFLKNQNFINTTLNNIISDKLVNEFNKIIFLGIKAAINNYLKDKKLEDIIDINKDLLEKTINKKIYSHFTKEEIKINKKNIIKYFEEKLRDPKIQNIIFEYIETNLIRQDITSDKKIKDIFDGKIISVIIKESDGIIDSLSEYMINIAKNKKELVSKIIISDIEKKGMFETMLVRFGGVRNDIKKIVDIVIEKKLPPYIESKKDELKIILKYYIEKNLSKISLNDLGLKQDVFDSGNITSILQKNLFNNEKLFAILNKLLGNLANDLINNLTIKEVIQLININSFDDLKIRLNSEFSIINNFIKKDNLLDNIENDTNKFLNIIISGLSSNIKISNLINSLDYNKREITINQLIDYIYKNDLFSKVKNDFLNNSLKKANDEFYSFVDQDSLKVDLSRIIHKLTIKKDSTENHEFKYKVKDMLKDTTLSFVEMLNSNLEKNTKIAIEDVFIKSLVDSLRINNREILEPVDFASIIRREVNNMESERIEAMFDFAKPIFKLLIWYGAWGGIIGLFVGLFEASRLK